MIRLVFADRTYVTQRTVIANLLKCANCDRQPECAMEEPLIQMRIEAPFSSEALSEAMVLLEESGQWN